MRLGALLLVGTVCLTGCGLGSADEGPLSVGGLGAGATMTLPEPRHGRGLDAVFGGALLCKEPGTDATIREVRVLSEVPSASTRSLVREITRVADRPGDAEWLPWNPTLAIRGDVSRIRSEGDLQGALIPEVEGYVIQVECGGDASQERTELLTEVEATPDGAWIKGLEVVYESDGDEHVLKVHGKYVICGPAVRDADGCRGRQGKRRKAR